MFDTTFYLLVVAGISIYFGQIVDWYSYHIKKEFLDSKSTEVMSVANWIQYAGRIANMAGVFLVSLTFEMGVSVSSIEYMFLFAMALVFVSVVLSLKKSIFVAPAYLLQRALCLKMFGGAGIVFYWTKLDKLILTKLLLASLIVNLSLLAALIAPVFAASSAPAFRMTFAYLGQFLNFASSIIVFAYIDRVLYKSDSIATAEHISSILWGKFLAIMLMPFILFAYIA